MAEKTAKTEEAQTVEAIPAKRKVFIPAERNGAKQLFVGVNGKGYTIPTNQDVFVDEAVYEALRRSRIAMKQRDEFITSRAGVKNMTGNGEA